jgi:ribose/xylose/arabinose/galactoside ABC-type transport system permease subunit
VFPDEDWSPSPAKAVRFRSVLGWTWTVFGPFLGLAMITVFFAVLTHNSGQFLSVDNWRTIAVHTVIVGTAALGMTVIIIAGGIDLSVGSTVALVTVCMALVMKKVDPLLPEALRSWHLTMPLAILLGVGLGGLCGAINGALISGLRVVPFIITLGTYQAYRGLATWLASSTTIYVPPAMRPSWFGRIVAIDPEPRWLLVAPGVWMLLGLSLALAILLRYSLLGRYAYAIGSNESTARLCGINVPAMKIVIYAIGGLATRTAASTPGSPTPFRTSSSASSSSSPSRWTGSVAGVAPDRDCLVLSWPRPAPKLRLTLWGCPTTMPAVLNGVTPPARSSKGGI